MIENTLAALKAIDITGAIRRDEDYKAEKAQIEDAISAGQARAQAIRDEIRDAEKAGGVDGEAVADAMLRGEVIEAVSVEKLQKELDTINAGLRTLNQRMTYMVQDRRMKSDPIETEINAAIGPLVEMLQEEAVASVKALAQIYADAEALSRLAPKSRAGSLSESLNDVLIAAGNAHLHSQPEYPVTRELHALAETPCMQYLKRRISNEAHQLRHRPDMDFVRLVAGRK
ncbi:hypothetical protein Sj15T_01720 [Sphingobium sp. TA15]|uniref:Uncharacterized protein n=1 Tax=Sphingobium indicum (strain DSM 16413 / CCM 7287 / MTCC 6362 / UT26 / NBRC 101211 / UT26S) TaxID=452662 RepID=D4YZQ1_SPHIU|nr:hypothetical protein [Sphingobium indicum]BAI95833.1 hypothetical protein SJA_C1-09990 [Sphingobium indicum UT26S]BDD65151.1 hypothetical protein Sj15T_01720 [Sphingobium sp. TA15]